MRHLSKILSIMENRERLNVYFEMEGLSYLLFHVVNIGNKDTPELKFSGFSNYYISYQNDDNHSVEKGYLTEEEIEKSTFHDYVEFTYHKDGTFLTKHKDFHTQSNRYNNPYGKGVRWTPINEIQGIQPIITIAIRRMNIYHSIKIEKEKSTVHNYICKNPDLFVSQGKYLVIVYLKEKAKPIACFTTDQVYSDIIIDINERLDLCILLQKHSFPEVKPYYTNYYGGGWVTPYLDNSISFCNKDTSIDEMDEKMRNIFNPSFSEFIRIMGDGHIINMTEEKLKIIDIVDNFYSQINPKPILSKPYFIKILLSSIPDLSSFNYKSRKEKEEYIDSFYQLICTTALS